MPWLDAVENGLLAEPLQRPPRLKPNSVYLERLDALRAWRKNTRPTGQGGIGCDFAARLNGMHRP